jgi:hypothetical protein
MVLTREPAELENVMNTPKKSSLAGRWQERRKYTYVDLISAFCAMVVIFLHLPDSVNANPMLWVLADVCAAIILLMLEFGRGDAWARLFSNFILCCAAFVGVWMLSDGLVVPPLLFIAYLVRAWQIYLTNPRGSMEEVNRVAIAAVAAGIPAAIIAGFSGWGKLAQFFLVEVFYLLSAWIHLYPAYEWLLGENPAESDSSSDTRKDL